MRTRREKIIHAYCCIGGMVSKAAGWQWAVDSLSEEAQRDREKYHSEFQYDNEVIAFVRQAVAEKIARDGAPQREGW